MKSLLSRLGLTACIVAMTMLSTLSAHAAVLSAGPGVFVSASDETVANRDPEKALWRAVSFNVADDGTFSAKTRVNTTKKVAANKMVSVITYDVVINGTYDAAAGTLSGTFTIPEEWNTTKSGTKFEQQGSGTYSGSFTGQPSADDKITLTFSGSRVYRTETTSSNGKVEEDENSYELQHVVTFPVSGKLPEAPAAASSAAKDSGAAFSDISGQVEVLVPTGYDANGKATYDEEAWTFAKLDMKLPAGTRIKTDSDSGVILSFADMTTFQMKPESEIILGDPSTPENPLKILAGDLLVQTKKLLEGKQLFEGSQAVAGIKGTTFVLTETGSSTTLKVIEGAVEFTPKTGGLPALVEVGATVTANSDGLSDVTPFDVAAEMATWDKARGSGKAKADVRDTGAGPSWLLVAGLGVVVLASGVGAAALVLSRRASAKRP